VKNSSAGRKTVNNQSIKKKKWRSEGKMYLDGGFGCHGEFDIAYMECPDRIRSAFFFLFQRMKNLSGFLVKV
jgi:hypothetical protein